MAINKITGEIVDDEENQFATDIAKVEINALISDEVYDIIEQYMIAKAQYDNWVAQHDQAIMDIMKSAGVKTIKTDYITLSYVSPSVRKTLDSKRLKEEHPDIYEEYLKESSVKESLRIKMRED